MSDDSQTLPGILADVPAVRLEDIPAPDEAPQTITGLPRNPDFTAARLFSAKPNLVPVIVGMLRESIPLLKIARACGVSVNTVIAVRDKCPADVDTGRAKQADTIRTAARVTAEAILEDLSDDERRGKVPFKDKAIALGVLIDKAELLSGGVTARIAHEYPVQLPDGSEHDAYNDMLRTGAGEIIDVMPEPLEMDSTGRKSAQKGGQDDGDGRADGGAAVDSGARAEGGLAPAVGLGEGQDARGDNTTCCGLGDKS